MSGVDGVVGGDMVSVCWLVLFGVVFGYVFGLLVVGRVGWGSVVWVDLL